MSCATGSWKPSRPTRRGDTSQEATAAAIAEFGDPDTVAAAFGPELARCRRVGWRSACWTAGRADLDRRGRGQRLPPWRHQLIGPWLAPRWSAWPWRSPVQRWA